MLTALATWAEVFKDPCTVTRRCDAQGILQGIIKGAAKSADIDLIFAEVQLVLAPLALDLTGIHWWSEHNKVCDHLSRPEDNIDIPESRRDVEQVVPCRRTWHFLQRDIRRQLRMKVM